jgi:hypothetical protein
LIGEAAHIHGARPQSKRYSSKMSDAARAEITNGIWLCRNCHKLIDTDHVRFSSDLLFAWREEHENYVLSELGNTSDRIRLDQQNVSLIDFNGYPPLIRRIILDKPGGWEWRLAAELMRYFNTPHFKAIKDLRDGFYIKPRIHIDEENILNWISKKLNEASNMVPPVEKLLDRLTLSFGKPGEEGDEYEIHHVCGLIRDYISEIIKHEETLYFASVPEKAENALELLKNCIGSQVEKLEMIPKHLDEVVSLIDVEHEGTKDNPKVINKTIIFELPKNWERDMDREISKFRDSKSGDRSSGGGSFIVTIIIIIFLVAVFF